MTLACPFTKTSYPHNFTMAPTDADAIANEPKHLFDLPAELRLQIYQEVISGYDIATVLRLPRNDGKYHLNLLNTCQTFRKEALRLRLEHLRAFRDLAREADDGSTLNGAVDDLEAIHFAEHCTAFDSGIKVARVSEEEYEKQGYRELLDWLLAHW